MLRTLAFQQPGSSLDELGKAFKTRAGVQVHSAALSKALRAAGIVRAKPPESVDLGRRLQPCGAYRVCLAASTERLSLSGQRLQNLSSLACPEPFRSDAVARAVEKYPIVQRLYVDSTEALTSGFTLMPKQWGVERTCAWNERARRLVMHHDRLTDVSEASVWRGWKPGFSVHPSTGSVPTGHKDERKKS